MKSLYEVARPVIETITLDGRIEIAIQYAYDLYRGEIQTMFDKGAVLDAWRVRLLDATVDADSHAELIRRMMLGQGQIESVSSAFYDRLLQSSLAYLVNSSQSVDYGELLFEELLKHQLLLEDEHREVARNYCTWLSWAVELVLHLDDTTQTFGDRDIEDLTYWVREVLTFAGPTEPVVAGD